MCLAFCRRRRRQGSDQAQKGSGFALKRLVATSTLIGPDRRMNSILVDGTGDEKAEFSVYIGENIRKHMRRVYDDQRGSKSLLSSEEFERFLRDIQHCDEELEAKPLAKDVYTFFEFLEAWYKHYGWRAMRRPVSKDLSKPISQYYISSSHNTYLEGNQLSSRSTSDAYRSVLQKDCRCIEIDVWNGEAASRTPSRSRSPHPGRHGRHLSAASAAASALELVEDKLESVVDRLSGNHHPGHHRTSSSNLPTPSALGPSKESSASLGPSAANEGVVVGGGGRASSRSSRQSARSGEEPIVMHGFTLTRPVGFREVCKAIRETAFKTNNLPIIVSLQVGATKEQQEVMVEIMKQEWEGLLLDKPQESCDPRHRQPRLDEVLGKILVKVKRAPEKDDTTVSPGLLSPPPTHETSDPATLEEESLIAAGAQKKKGKNEPICESLGRLAVYTHSEHFEGLDSPGAKMPGHIFSLSEKQIEKLYATKRAELHKHNSSYFMRAYPNSSRINSSNPDPSYFWRRGVQMVAMNWQNLDEGMMLNWGMFAGEKGWVLKPDTHRAGNLGCLSPATSKAPEQGAQRSTIPQKTLDLLRITFLAGQQIPLPPTQDKPGQSQTAVGGATARHFRPYVKCEIHVGKGGKGDTTDDAGATRKLDRVYGASATGPASEGPHKEHTKPGKTDFPDFGRNGDTMEFKSIQGVVEELTFVRFKIQDDSAYYRGEVAAWACIRLDRLRQGYRFVELLSPKGSPTDGKLFVRIDKIVR